jgi:hypothetical protein
MIGVDVVVGKNAVGEGGREVLVDGGAAGVGEAFRFVAALQAMLLKINSAVKNKTGCFFCFFIFFPFQDYSQG